MERKFTFRGKKFRMYRNRHPSELLTAEKIAEIVDRIIPLKHVPFDEVQERIPHDRDYLDTSSSDEGSSQPRPPLSTTNAGSSQRVEMAAPRICDSHVPLLQVTSEIASTSANASRVPAFKSFVDPVVFASTAIECSGSSTLNTHNSLIMKGGNWKRSVRDIRKASNVSVTLGQMTMSHRMICTIKEVSNGRPSLKASEAASHVDLFDGSNQKTLLLERCGQTDVMRFDAVYSKSSLKRCTKIGEGLFGEVYQHRVGGSKRVLKIVPIEGTEAINGTQQKRFHEILHEVIMSQELSALRHDDPTHQTFGFAEILGVRLVQGRYPAYLLDLWREYEENNGSDNDCPECFGENQLYVVFELAFAGTDLEKYVFENTDQAFSVFKQVAISLAVAESKFEFEHRDLHWGNLLIAPTAEKFLNFSLNGKKIAIPSYGVKATIIDYTLSRMLYRGCCLFQDLSADPELFEAKGDYQFDIYRLMRSRTGGEWKRYVPATNLLWMHYLCHKIYNYARYANSKAKNIGKSVRNELKQLKNILLEHFISVTDYVETIRD